MRNFPGKEEHKIGKHNLLPKQSNKGILKYIKIKKPPIINTKELLKPGRVEEAAKTKNMLFSLELSLVFQCYGIRAASCNDL